MMTQMHGLNLTFQTQDLQGLVETLTQAILHVLDYVTMMSRPTSQWASLIFNQYWGN